MHNQVVHNRRRQKLLFELAGRQQVRETEQQRQQRQRQMQREAVAVARARPRVVDNVVAGHNNEASIVRASVMARVHNLANSDWEREDAGYNSGFRAPQRKAVVAPARAPAESSSSSSSSSSSYVRGDKSVRFAEHAGAAGDSLDSLDGLLAASSCGVQPTVGNTVYPTRHYAEAAAPLPLPVHVPISVVPANAVPAAANPPLVSYHDRLGLREQYHKNRAARSGGQKWVTTVRAEEHMASEHWRQKGWKSEEDIATMSLKRLKTLRNKPNEQQLQSWLAKGVRNVALQTKI